MNGILKHNFNESLEKEMYPFELKESILRVEITREKRLKEDFKHSDLDKKNLLREYHPNFIDGKMRPLLIGPNRGDKAPNELADLLEGNSCINPEMIDLERVDYNVDVLILGGGSAGASAAISAKENGVNVLLATKSRFIESDTMDFQGGIQAAVKPNDSPYIHYLDTVGGGCFVNDPDLVEALVYDAPFIIQWLESLGVMFDKGPDGEFQTEFGEGTSRKRVHNARNRIGLEVMRILCDEVYNRGILVLEYSPAIELIMDDKGQAAGAILINLESMKEITIVRAKAVVLATGGDGQLHYQGFPCIDHYGATADGLVMAYRAGVKLLLLDALQYFPTCIVYPEQMIGKPIDEKFRKFGAKLVNKKGEQFVYHLEHPDILTSAIIKECKNNNGLKTPNQLEGVWLDTPMIEIVQGRGSIQREFPNIYMEFKTFGIDITKEPILVSPSYYFNNGGIKIDSQGSTNIPNLYAAGKISGGIHGRYMLRDNLLLDSLVFGLRAGKNAAIKAKETSQGKLTLDHIRKWQNDLKNNGLVHRPISPILIPDYSKYGKLIRSDWNRYYRFELRKEEKFHRTSPIDVKIIEDLLKQILTLSTPPVARARLLSRRGISVDNKLDILDNIIGSKTCLGCGNCNDICPVIAREPDRRQRTEERTSMALETILVGPDECDRCYACILVCPQVDITIKQYVVNNFMVEAMSKLGARIDEEKDLDLDLFIEECLLY